MQLDKARSRPSIVRLSDAGMLLTLAAVLAVPGCAGRERPEPVPALESASIEGRVAFDFLPDPNSPRLELTPDQSLTGPVPEMTPLPEYPPEALAPGAPPVTLVVRIIVEEDGSVQQVFASPLAGPAESGVGGPFWTATARALRTWMFVPAIVRTIARGRKPAGGEAGDDWEFVDAKPVRAYMDLRLKFEVVDGRGRVQLEPNP